VLFRSPGLGPLRWASIARRGCTGKGIAALGGVDGRTVKRLPFHLCHAIGAIGALAVSDATTPIRWPILITASSDDRNTAID
jgi:hypothetical protein